MAVSWNKQVLEGFEAQVQKNLDKASVQASKVAARYSTKNQQVDAYIREMKKHGVNLNKREVEKFF